MRICIFGDSIVWGEGDQERGGWVDRLKVSLMPRDVSVYNLGIRGDTSEDILRRFIPEVQARSRKLDTIVIALGANDSKFLKGSKDTLVPVQKFRENIETLTEQARQFVSNVMFVGITSLDESVDFSQWDSLHTNASTLLFDQQIKEICLEKNVLYVPMYDVLSAGDWSDGLHPNASGYQKMFERIKPAIETLLRQ